MSDIEIREEIDRLNEKLARNIYFSDSNFIYGVNKVYFKNRCKQIKLEIKRLESLLKIKIPKDDCFFGMP